MREGGGESQLGLSIDDSDHNGGSAASLATKAAEAQLQGRIHSLQEQLQAAKSALEKLHTTNTSTTEQNKEEPTATAMTTTIERTSPTSVALPAPVSKRGYLFKWNDRSIGWSGTKWGLRFVTLDGHHGQLAYYGSHLDRKQARYQLSLRGCAVRDDGWKRNLRHKKRTGQEEEDPPLEEPGAYFFLFSIYQRPPDDDGTPSNHHHSDLDNVVPLLRFSTPSLAEKTQWIQLISEVCAYCETDQWVQEEAERQAELDKQQRQQILMDSAMPEAKEGTLPPLFFAPHVQKKKYKRQPSFTKTNIPRAASFRTKSKNADVDKEEKKSTLGYPPSKPMHRSAAPSYLSVEAPVQNYRGIFNLGILILIVANVRLIVLSVKSHGFVMTRLVQHLQDLPHIRRDPWEEFPFISGFLLQLVFITIGLSVEKLLSRQRIPQTIGIMFHHMNAYAALLIPMWIVWTFIDKPAVGAALLLHATITWMKLLSYILANEDYRNLSSGKEQQQQADGWKGLVDDLDPDDAEIRYPDNVTLSNIFYFWFCPSLTYQIAFPKLPRRRWYRMAGLLMRMVLCFVLFTFVAAQVVSPSLSRLVEDLEASGGTYTYSMMAEYWLKLAIANTYLWLLMFYFYFHLYLNFFAEILRFGDRVFYKDWWNSSEVSAYWRLWNMPVHYWMIRHVYFPCLRHNVGRQASTFVVFLVSAIMHEVLVSVPFHIVRPWSFLGMMLQMPLVWFTKYLNRKKPGTSMGNIVFWLSFCVVGQPMAILLYTIDYRYAQQHAERILGMEFLAREQVVEQCRVMWDETCLIR